MINWNVFAKRKESPIHIETKRLLIREFTKSDWQDVHEYASDDEVVTYLLWGPNASQQESIGFVEGAIEAQRERPRSLYDLAVVLQGENKLIGACGIRITSDDIQQAELGYCFNKKYWGKGYATEACTALMKHAFENLNLHRVYATCDPLNIASAKILTKLGMRQEGHFIQDKKVRGRFRDTLLFAKLAEENK